MIAKANIGLFTTHLSPKRENNMHERCCNRWTTKPQGRSYTIQGRALKILPELLRD